MILSFINASSGDNPHNGTRHEFETEWISELNSADAIPGFFQGSGAIEILGFYDRDGSASSCKVFGETAVAGP